MGEEPVDLDALQQQLRLKRASLADQILARLPEQREESRAGAEPLATSSRPATLGVGASTGKGQTGRGQLSAQDQKLRAKLGAKRPREQTPASAPPAPPADEDEGDGRSALLGKRKGNDRRRGRDVFAEAEAKRKVHAPPPEVAGLSKAQRKKLNKRRRLDEERQDGARDVQENEQPKERSAEPAGDEKREAPKQAAAPADAASPSPGAPLTALQSSMLTSLKGARFRTVNETLYTSSSDEALALMQREPQLYGEYHDGFRQQVRKWPKNPLDRITELLMDTGDAARKGRKHSCRTARVPGALIVDIGAGEAGLARKLLPHGRHVLSYDLLDSRDGYVRGMDAAQLHALPLPGVHEPLGVHWTGPGEQASEGPACVDAAVFSLSLMGTNWLAMIAEARRVLREQGELIIAEVSSRLGPTCDTRAFVELVCATGFDLDWQDTSNTHFVLFKFSKHTHTRAPAQAGAPLDTSAAPGALATAAATPAQAHEALDALIGRSAAALRPCLYKRR